MYVFIIFGIDIFCKIVFFLDDVCKYGLICIKWYIFCCCGVEKDV